MGPDSRKKKPVTTRALEPEMKRFLWDRLQEARNGALRNIGLSGDLPQTEALALLMPMTTLSRISERSSSATAAITV